MCGIIQVKVERGKNLSHYGKEIEDMKNIIVKKHVTGNDELSNLHGMLKTMGFKKTSSCYWFETWERSDGYSYEISVD